MINSDPNASSDPESGAGTTGKGKRLQSVAVHRWAARVADWIAILTPPLSLVLIVVPERYRPVVAIAMAACFLIALTRIGTLVEKKNRARSKLSGPPRVLLIGGAEYKNVMNDVEHHYLVTHNQFIKFVEALVEQDKDGWQHIREDLEHSEAIILMPDFTRRTHPGTHAEFVKWRAQRAEPVLRYYPHDFIPDPRDVDYERLAFETVNGIVDYSSEHLLTRAVNNGRYLERRIQLRNNVIRTILVAPFILGSLMFLQLKASSSLQEHSAVLQRALEMPPEVSEEMAGILAEFRTTNQAIGTERQAQIRTLLTGWLKIQADEITRVSEDTHAKFIYIYGLSNKDDRLTPVVWYGPREYSLDKVKSIAGCAYSNRVVAEWEGNGNKTAVSRAWTLAGQETTDVKCEFEDTHKENPVSQLLCAPIGVDGSAASKSVPGVICVSTNAASSFMSSDWMRWYLIRQIFPLGVIDMATIDIP